MIVIEHGPEIDRITIRASGTLTGSDYDAALAEIEHAITLSQEPLRVLLRLEDVQGMEVEALWKSLKVGLRLRAEFRSIAVVGETVLEELITELSTPFTCAQMRYFTMDEEDQARHWLATGK